MEDINKLITVKELSKQLKYYLGKTTQNKSIISLIIYTNKENIQPILKIISEYYNIQEEAELTIQLISNPDLKENQVYIQATTSYV